MSRNVLITAADGQTGFLIAELLLTNTDFSSKVDSITCLTLHPSSAKAKQLIKLGAKVVPHPPGREREMVKLLKETECDTICSIPPTHKEKVDITMELIDAARKANVTNGVLISSAGCDFAERDK
jgi:nucleoside-diphosphate-sugar epimerase